MIRLDYVFGAKVPNSTNTVKENGPPWRVEQQRVICRKDITPCCRVLGEKYCHRLASSEKVGMGPGKALLATELPTPLETALKEGMVK